jgi:hypothetical protein
MHFRADRARQADFAEPIDARPRLFLRMKLKRKLQMPAKKSAKKTSKRTLIEPRKGDRRYVRRDAKGHFTDKQVDVGRSLAADRRSEAKKKVPKGQGDRGDTRK